MCLGFLHFKHTKSLFSSHLSLTPLDVDSFSEEFILEVNFLPLGFSPLMNLLNFFVMRVKSSSSSLSFSSSTSSSSLVVVWELCSSSFRLLLLVASLSKWSHMSSIILWAPPKVACSCLWLLKLRWLLHPTWMEVTSRSSSHPLIPYRSFPRLQDHDNINEPSNHLNNSFIIFHKKQFITMNK